MMPTSRFAAALQYTVHLHGKQKRKRTGVPYISHLLGVTSLVLDSGASEDEAIAALLHDAVEDQGGSLVLRSIRERFGDNVAQIVLECTDAEVFPKPDWRTRKITYLDHLINASPSAVLVSAADKLHNARAILRDYRAQGDQVWNRFHGGREGTLWYYRALVDILRTRGSNYLIAELERVVTELEQQVRDH